MTYVEGKDKEGRRIWLDVSDIMAVVEEHEAFGFVTLKIKSYPDPIRISLTYDEITDALKRFKEAK